MFSNLFYTVCLTNCLAKNFLPKKYFCLPFFCVSGFSSEVSADADMMALKAELQLAVDSNDFEAVIEIGTQLRDLVGVGNKSISNPEVAPDRKFSKQIYRDYAKQIKASTQIR